MTKRALIDPFVVAPPRAVSTRTRLFLSTTDEKVVVQFDSLTCGFTPQSEPLPKRATTGGVFRLSVHFALLKDR